MTPPLTAVERDALIDRIAARIAALDDGALAELDRVTDEANYLPGAPPIILSDEDGASPGLTRAQLLAGFVVLALASLGTALPVRGVLPIPGCP